MQNSLRDALSLELGSELVHSSSVGGGCINEAYRCRLADGRELFIKTHADAPEQMFQREAEGLRFLAEACALRIPVVFAVSAAGSEHDYLVLEYIGATGHSGSFDEELGRGLAALHEAPLDSFGLEHSNYLATLVQDNEPSSTWAEFYVERRLRPQLELAASRGLARPNWRADFERLFGKMSTLVGQAEPPSRLHGDLWSGNVHSDETGAPVLIDPAVYGGHREVDLAMLQLFGSPGPRFFAAYDERYPLAAGYRERVALYQLYPLLAHVNLFGGSYQGQVESCLRSYL